jgi:hypothetical protein
MQVHVTWPVLHMGSCLIVPFTRASPLDRNGHTLATSGQTDRLAAVGKGGSQEATTEFPRKILPHTIGHESCPTSRKLKGVDVLAINIVFVILTTRCQNSHILTTLTCWVAPTHAAAS